MILVFTISRGRKNCLQIYLTKHCIKLRHPRYTLKQGGRRSKLNTLSSSQRLNQKVGFFFMKTDYTNMLASSYVFSWLEISYFSMLFDLCTRKCMYIGESEYE